MSTAADVVGLVTAGFRLATLSYRLLCVHGDKRHCIPDNVENRYEALSYCWSHVEEKIRGLQSDQCSKRHEEVTHVLEHAGHLVQRLKLKMDMAMHKASAPGTLDFTVTDSQQGRDLFEYVLPAAELLEEALDRLWLHVHVVKVSDRGHNSSAAVLAPHSDNLTARGPEAGSDWVQLERIPVIKKGSDETEHGMTIQLNGNARAILVDENCTALAKSEGLLGAAQHPASQLSREAWGLDLRSSIILSEFAPTQDSERPDRSENLLHIVRKTRASPSAGRKNVEWLCFSDLLEPANNRPMFGHLLQRHSAFKPLHMARVRALALIDSILDLPQGTYARSKATGLGSLRTIQELIDCSYWLFDQQSEVPDELISRDGADFLPDLHLATDAGLATATDFGFKKSTFGLNWLSPAALRPMDGGDNTRTFKSHLADTRQLSWTDWLPESVSERHFVVRATQCVMTGVEPFNLSELFAAATTKIRPHDPEWSGASSNIDDQLQKFLKVCSPFLEPGKNGKIRFRSPGIVQSFLRDDPDFAIDAQTFMAFMCLQYLCEMDPRTTVWPWSNYQKLEFDPDSYLLHRYVVNNWQHHYQLAEPHNTDLPRQFHGLIERVWLNERTEMSREEGTSDVDLDAYNEALDVGLILSQAYDFEILKSAYLNMGACTHRHPSDPHKQATGQSSPILPGSDEHMITLDNLSPSSTPSPTPKPETERHDAFDFSEWCVVPPLNPPQTKPEHQKR